MIKNKFINRGKIILVALSFVPLAALAASSQELQIGEKIDTVTATLKTVIGVLFVLATVIFLWGVIQFVASAGDEQKRTKAKGIMTWGIIGLAVMAAAWGVVSLLAGYFGITAGQSGIPNPYNVQTPPAP